MGKMPQYPKHNCCQTIFPGYNFYTPVQKKQKLLLSEAFSQPKIDQNAFAVMGEFPHSYWGGGGKKHPPIFIRPQCLIGRLNFQRILCFDSWYLLTLCPVLVNLLKVSEYRFVIKNNGQNNTQKQHFIERCIVVIDVL